MTIERVEKVFNESSLPEELKELLLEKLEGGQKTVPDQEEPAQTKSSIPIALVLPVLFYFFNS